LNAERFVDLPHIRLHVLEWTGPAGASPIVLAHGLSSNAHIWDAVAPRLAERHRVVALDQRGHGLSDKPDEGYAFESIVADLRALIEALALERPVLVGHSWGGNVAVQYAATYPDDVAGLVLVDGGFLELADRPEMTWERVSRDLAPPDLSALTMEQLLGRARDGYAVGYWGPAVEATLRGSFAIESDGRVRPRLSRAHHMLILRALWEQRPSPFYDLIRCPSLIVPARRSEPDPRGEQFRAARVRQVARAAAGIRNARVLWMEETVHDVPLHRPRELAEAILELAADSERWGTEGV
jgi:pimeloyl-ACP methyl ester carboxylesterase